MQRNNTCNTTSDSSSKQRQTIVNLTTTHVHIQQTYKHITYKNKLCYRVTSGKHNNNKNNNDSNTATATNNTNRKLYKFMRICKRCTMGCDTKNEWGNSKSWSKRNILNSNNSVAVMDGINFSCRLYPSQFSAVLEWIVVSWVIASLYSKL